ncbi:hypothetical protein ACS0TY_034538 [Phlomoides rotata]
MEARGTAIAPNQEKGKVVRGRRSWSKFEKDALIHCLIDIVNDGWKAENGFKAGFQRELERHMHKLLPGTDIVANPHINSKIHVWKKEYGALSNLLSKSGIGWNSTTSMIEVDDEEVWDASRRADPHLKCVRFKSWPYYSQWMEIFGKDRATGENAVDPLDLFYELMSVNLEQEGEVDEKYVALAVHGQNEVYDSSICKPLDSALKTNSKGKKRKTSDADLSMLVDSLGEFMKFSKEAMIKESLSNSKTDGQYESGSKHEQSKLIDSLKGITGMKISDKLKVCDELVQNSLRLELFLSLPADEQEEYFQMILDGRLYYIGKLLH